MEPGGELRRDDGEHDARLRWRDRARRLVLSVLMSAFRSLEPCLNPANGP